MRVQRITMETTNIYTLSDPISNLVRYVGKTDNPKRRLMFHKCDKKANVYKFWIRDLRLNGQSPILDVVDTVPKNEWEFWEKHYISLYRSWGFKLFNIADGGKGCCGLHFKISEEHKKMISLKMTGIKKTEEQKKKMRETGMYDVISKKLKGRLNPYHIELKPVNQFDLNNNFIAEHGCCAYAAKSINARSGGIWRCCNGINNTAYGFIWKYKN